jgi:general secretion pathway protein A
MYEAFYGLREKPFSILPDPDLIYWGQNHRLALAMLEFGVLNSAGFTVITGEIGSGKTTLVRHLLRKLDPDLSVGLISNTPQGRDELLQWVLMSLNQPFEGPYPSLYFRFEQYLLGQHANGRRTILIIDEAQNLQPGALEALRMLSNINADKEQFLQLILVGQPQLKDLLSSPQLVQFAQRISSDFHLKPLSCEDAVRYIDYRLAAVGARRPLFSREACERIAEASSGIPRSINILCDTALVYGFANQADWITKQIVEDVIENKKAFGIFGSLSSSHA